MMKLPSAENFWTRSLRQSADVDVADPVDRDAPGQVELAVSAAVAAEAGQEPPVLGELAGRGGSSCRPGRRSRPASKAMPEGRLS